MSGISQKILLIYSVSMSTVFGIVLLTGAATPKHDSFDELTVHRINVVEPDGTLRMVISDHAKLPGIIVHGQERPFSSKTSRIFA
jgi:hypothetical protein